MQLREGMAYATGLSICLALLADQKSTLGPVRSCSIHFIILTTRHKSCEWHEPGHNQHTWVRHSRGHWVQTSAGEEEADWELTQTLQWKRLFPPCHGVNKLNCTFLEVLSIGKEFFHQSPCFARTQTCLGCSHAPRRLASCSISPSHTTGVSQVQVPFSGGKAFCILNVPAKSQANNSFSACAHAGCPQECRAS